MQFLTIAALAGLSSGLALGCLALWSIIRMRAALVFAAFVFVAGFDRLVYGVLAFQAPLYLQTEHLVTLHFLSRAAVGIVYIAFMESFLGQALMGRGYARLSRITQLSLIGSSCLVVLGQWHAVSLAYSLILALFGGTILWAIWIALRSELKGRVLFAIGTGLMALVSILSPTMGPTPTTTDISQEAFARVLIVSLLHYAEVLTFAAAIIWRAIGMKSARDAAQAAEKAAVLRRHEEERLRLVAEHNRDLARARLAATHHDLRQPLTSLRLTLEKMAGEDENSAGALRSGLDYIRDVLAPEATRAASGSADHPDGQTDIYNLSEVVAVQTLFDNLQRMFAGEAEAKGLHLRVEPSDLLVRTHVISLIRALSNLISNAVRYTQTGVITVSASARGECVDITVADTGPGMDAPTLARVQRRGERHNTVEDGEGLGLAIVAELAREMGGQFQAVSKLGEGSTFTIKNIAAES